MPVATRTPCLTEIPAALASIFLVDSLSSVDFHGNFTLVLRKMTAKCNNEKLFLCQLDECEFSAVSTNHFPS